MKYRIIKIFCLSLFIVIPFACNMLDEQPYSRILSEDYYSDKKSILQAVFRTYEHGHWYSHNDRFHAQELTADHFVWAQKGRHGYDGGQWIRMHHHSWTPQDGVIKSCWIGAYQGIGYANKIIEDITPLNYVEFDMTEKDKITHLSELRIIRAWYYIWLIDFFRRVPVVERVSKDDLPFQQEPQEVFNYIEKEIKEIYSTLPILKTQAEKDSWKGRFTQAGAMVLLARLYLNAEVWIGKPMYNECAKICDEILKGDYGTYSLATDWRQNFMWNNDQSPEAIWFIAREDKQLTFSFYYDAMMHYNSKYHWNFTRLGGWNGVNLTPSYDPNGNSYIDKFSAGLGIPFQRFNNLDLRKKNARNLGGGYYEGMFNYGLQMSYDGKDTIKGSEEYNGKPLIFVDSIARFSEGKKISDVQYGEENSGVRFVKFFWYPDNESQYIYNADQPLIRLTEVYFMLAECKLRGASSTTSLSAYQLVNKVIERNYLLSDWNDDSKGLQYTNSTLTLDKMLEEWGREFMGECRRRTDLIRFGKFTTGVWWAFNNTLDGAVSYGTENKPEKIIFPIPQDVLAVNPNIKQQSKW